MPYCDKASINRHGMAWSCRTDQQLLSWWPWVQLPHIPDSHTHSLPYANTWSDAFLTYSGHIFLTVRR